MLKGVIIAAGYGTRFLPVTKTVPKEMLPLINKPSIDFIVEEFIQSGIRDILVISSRRKKVLEDYFDREVELEDIFKRENKKEKLDKIKPHDANFYFVRQKKMKGTGHALLLAKSFAESEPFIVAYPDDLHFGDVPLSRQLIDMYKKTGCCVLATIHNPPNLNRYGIIDIAKDGLHVKNIVEKPPKGEEPSREVSIGRFLFIPEIFTYLDEGWKEHVNSGQEGEYYHIHAIRALCQAGRVVYKQAEGERLDTGEPAGFLQAVIQYAKKDPKLREIIKKESFPKS
jgi:UTP--glucose-1-phosphate uridylyltransferase